MAETTISRNWIAKMALFIAAFFGLGIWGLVDATIVYPAKGRAFADYMAFKYLEASDESGELLRASVPDPQAALADLQARKDELVEEVEALPAESMSRRRKQAELLRYGWLGALEVIGHDTPKHTVFEDPAATLEELRAEWATAAQPKPLSRLDLPTQWLFVAIGVLGGGWMLLTVMRVTKTRYRYDEDTHTLTLPDGTSFTPAEITELDKRKWDKFFVTITLADGSQHKLDLLRYQPLEDWVLEMEKLSPNYEPPDEPAAGDEAAAAPGENPEADEPGAGSGAG